MYAIRSYYVPLDVAALQTDVCLAGVQKAFGLPPGLAVFAVSRRALEKARNTPNRGYYFDFEEFEANDLKDNVITSYSIHYTKLYEHVAAAAGDGGGGGRVHGVDGEGEHAGGEWQPA